MQYSNKYFAFWFTPKTWEWSADRAYKGFGFCVSVGPLYVRIGNF